MLPLLAKLNRPVVAILAVGAIAGVLRFTHLGYPEQRIFDEYYYSKSACIFLGYSDQRCDVNSDDERYWRENRNDTGSWVHPPLGKWMIAVGELAFGTSSFGWRVSGAVVGTVTVVLLAFIVQLLFASPIWTFAGGLLLAVENLSFVQSRTAMLDVFVAFWIVLAFALLLLDRRWIGRRAPDPAGTGREPVHDRISEVALLPETDAFAGSAAPTAVATRVEAPATAPARTTRLAAPLW
ncbi:MAG: phospholipid carrier-dependent glycosyltransferase, partial [Actinomycetota bacterium]